MEWVETTAKTVDEAKDLLLDQLGVDEQEAEFDVLDEPRPGMFGRLRGNARVRARIAPKAPRQKDERRRRSSGDRGRKRDSEQSSEQSTDTATTDEPEKIAPAADSATGEESSKADRPAPARAPKKAPAAASDSPALSVEDASSDITEFLDEFTSRFGIEATTSIEVSDEGELMVSLQGEQLGRLIGPRGGMMTALEELCRTRLQHRAAGGDRPRLRLDVGGYREMRRENLRVLVEETAGGVRTTGQPHVIDVVTASERKVIHDYVAENADDLVTSSEGEDPARRVVISPS